MLIALFVATEWSVHIDVPENVAAFERAQSAWSAWLVKQGPPRHVNEIQVGERRFSLRRQEDRPATKRTPDEQKTLQALDLACDKEVRHHHSEIWQSDDDFKYLAPGGPNAVVRWHDEIVNQSKVSDYNEAVTAFHKAVARANKVTIVWFWPRYGSAQSHWLCQAATEADLALCDPERVLGKPLLQKWKNALVESAQEAGRFRTDLTNEAIQAWP